MRDTDGITCWVVSEGMAGTENQCLGVAEALGAQPVIHRISLRQPWKALSPWFGFECAYSFDPPLQPPWPDVVIASGRKAVAACRYIKKQSGGRAFTVFLQDPRISSLEFDLVAMPFHDAPDAAARGKNVIVTDTAPNRITDKSLSNARDQLLDLASYHSPHIAVLIGGKSKAYDLPVEVMRDLIQSLKNVQEQHHASLFITASRRTGAQNMSLLEEAFQHNPNIYFWDGQGENPYQGFLAHADYILVTADSVSMISDALATGKPTYIIDLPGGARRIDLFHRNILEKGYARIFKGDIEPYEYPQQNAARIIADVIERKIAERF